MEEIVKLTRDLTAVQVPFGTPAFLDKDTKVSIAHALGGSYTITYAGNMYRVESKDADALGKEEEKLTFTIAGNENTTLENKIWGMLRTCYDPEIPVNIVDLGLIYGVDIEEKEKEKEKEKERKKPDVVIRMTLTAPGCGMGPIIASDAKRKVLNLDEVGNVEVEMVFDPPWDRTMMSEQAKLQLGLL